MHRPYPSNVDAERALLGGLMLDARRMDDLPPLSPSDFYQADHGRLWALLAHRAARGEPVDAVALLDAIAPDPAAYGGIAYVIGLPEYSVSTANLDSYARSIRAHSRARTMIRDLEEATDALFSGTPPDTVSERLMSTVDGPDVGTGEWVSLGQAAQDAVRAIEDRTAAGGPDGYATGLTQLDSLLRLQRGKLLVIGARPAMGKSTLALQLATGLAEQDVGHVGYVTIEMDATENAERHLARISGVPSWRMRLGSCSAADLDDLFADALRLGSQPLSFLDAPGLGLSGLVRSAKRLHRRGPLAALFVDYLQLLDLPGENRAQSVHEATKGLKRLARELDCCVVLVAQLNRGVEMRTDKRPILADLRDSGGIEQDADQVLFIYRDEVYNSDSADRGRAELLLRKNRGGPFGVVRVQWIPSRFAFADLEAM